VGIAAYPSEQAYRCQNRKRAFSSSTYAEGVLRRQARVRELAIALDEDDLGEDGDGDLSRRLVADAQPDGRVQAKVLARIAPEAAGDVAPAPARSSDGCRSARHTAPASAAPPQPHAFHRKRVADG